MPRPLIINADRDPDPANPHTWLPLSGSEPGEEGPRIMTGTLRGLYRKFEPTAVMFGQAKLQPVPAVDGDPWAVTAIRAEVLLPDGADDRYASPEPLMREADARATSPTDARLAYVTFTWMPSRLHQQWEEIRTFCLEELVATGVRGFGCPVLLVQHAPHLQRSGNEPHCHLLIVPHALHQLGWSTPVNKLTGDRGRKTIIDCYNDFRARRTVASA